MDGDGKMMSTGTVTSIDKQEDRVVIYIKEIHKFNFHVIAPKDWNGNIGDKIEYEHFAVNAAWLVQKPIKLWIVIYHHRFGTDGMPVWSVEEPNLEEFEKTLSYFEPDREDEYLELSGPFDIPSF